MRRSRNRSGFTLLEIATAAAIIGMILAFVIPKVVNVKHFAYTDQVLNSMRNLMHQQEVYFNKYNTYAEADDEPNLNFFEDNKVNIEVTLIDPYSFIATGEHLSFAGVYCALAFGKFIPDGYTHGKIECTDPPGS